MKDKNKLLYDLVFSDKEEFIINIEEYIEDIYRYDVFIDDIKKILKKSKVLIVKNTLDVFNESVVWKIIVRK